MTRDLILKSHLSPGDVVMMTAAVRDLHLAHPGAFRTDVRTSAGAVWENNPYLTPLSEDDPGVRVIEMRYDLIHQSNQGPYHFVHGYARHLEDELGVRIPVTRFKGDVHLSDLEKSWMSQVEEDPIGWRQDFWILIAGGKYDFTAKWWDPARFQAVVDHFAGRVKFVQCGEANHWHPRLRGVIDLVGKTDTRQFIRLMYHAAGVICPVTFAMHLAAAVETKPGRPLNRACVVVAGGREPSQWEKYGHHRYLDVNGALPCCDNGGCWRSRCQPVGDGDEKDHPDRLCLEPVPVSPGLVIPRCLDLITAHDVIRAVEQYHDGGALRYLPPPPGDAPPAPRPRPARPGRPGPRVAFTTVTDAWYFPGTLAAVNSVFRHHPRAEVIVVEDGARPLSADQRRLLESGGAVVAGADRFLTAGRHPGPYELKAYAACDLAPGYDVLVGIDSDCVLCGAVDDVVARALGSGRFTGGKDGDGVTYGAAYAAYGIAPGSRNPSYMSTSLYFCPVTPANLRILDRWAECTGAAVYNGRGPFPGHGDQGVLNGVLFAALGPDGVDTLENDLWSQHWRYWESELFVERGVLRNASAGRRRQRSLHCGGGPKFWDAAHRDRILSTNPAQALAYAWWLDALWEGRCTDPTADPAAFLPPGTLHLVDDRTTFAALTRRFRDGARPATAPTPDAPCQVPPVAP